MKAGTIPECPSDRTGESNVVGWLPATRPGKPKRVLVCGGRDYADREHLFRELDLFHGLWPIETIITGGAAGADRLAGAWALARNVRLQEFPADWSRGRRAGPERNVRMLAEGRPHLVIHFPGGRGTADMVAKARAAGVPAIPGVIDIPKIPPAPEGAVEIIGRP